MEHIQHFSNMKDNIEHLKNFYEWLGRDFKYLAEDMSLFYKTERDENLTLNPDIIRDFMGVVKVWFNQDHSWGGNDNFVNGGMCASVFSSGLQKIPLSAYPVVKFHPMSAFKGWRTPRIKIIDLPIRTFFLDRLYNY